MRNHVKLFSKGAVRRTAVYSILAMGLADLLGIADLHCQKVESTKWLRLKLCHIRKTIV